MKVALIFLGCRVNQAETGELEKELRGRGHTIVEMTEGPDVCIVNTCTVTSKSDYQSRQLIRRAARTGAKVLATGCYAELNPEELLKINGVESVIGNNEKPNIINQFSDLTSGTTSGSPENIKKKSKFFLKVQDGCDNSCTYCRVWIARGRSRSIEPEKVISRAMEAESAGYGEIVLTGVHLGMYGKDIGIGSQGVAHLLERILNNTSHSRIRLSSLEVNEIDSKLLDLISNSRVCKHLHIPIQSGDNRVLDGMGRRYNRADVMEKVSLVSRVLGEVGLGSDIIAGFPGEDEAAFANTVELVNDLPLTYLHVFPYSARPGTAASQLPEFLGNIEKKSRAAVLRDVGEQKRALYMDRQVGQHLSVLLETHKPDGSWIGTSGNYLKVRVNCDITSAVADNSRMVKGSLVDVRITGTEGTFLLGDVSSSM